MGSFIPVNKITYDRIEKDTLSNTKSINNTDYSKINGKYFLKKINKRLNRFNICCFVKKNKISHLT